MRKPRTPDRTQALPMSHTELMNRSPITWLTGRRYSREMPMSPFRKSFAQLKNRSAGGTPTPQ